MCIRDRIGADRGSKDTIEEEEEDAPQPKDVEQLSDSVYYKMYLNEMCIRDSVIAAVKNRNYKFIIYMDDLSFEEFEIEYKFLKAVIEGGVETKPDNILIYATSNRRHLIRETWSDRNDVQPVSYTHLAWCLRCR